LILDPQFRAGLLDQVHNAVIGTDPDGRVVYWNRAAEQVYQWTAEEAMGRLIYDLTVPPESLQQAARIMEELAREGHWKGEFVVRRKDGTTFPALVTDSLVRRADGAVAGYIGITADLSDLRAAEEKYRRVVETAAEGICMIDPSGRAEFVNRRMAEMLGYDFDATPAIDAREMVFDDDRETARALFERRRRGMPEEEELRLRRRDGAAIWTRVSASPLREDGGALWMVTDISRRIAGEEALRRLAETNIIGVVTADRERVLEANSSFLAMLGYTREDLEAGRLRWPEMTPPEYAELDRRGYEEMMATGVCRPFEKEFFRVDGSRVPALLGASLLNDNPEWLCFVLDLTERKRVEAAVRDLRHTESVGFLAAGVAHNLNNLLVAVIGNASLLVESPGLPLDRRQLAGDILQSGERAAKLTRQLLAYAGKGGFFVRPTAVSRVVAGLEGVLRASIPQHIDLRFKLARDLPAIHADENQIRQIVTDLALNAAEAIDGAAGSIGIATRLATVNSDGGAVSGIGDLRPGRYILIEVEDTGGGISSAVRPRLFDPFFSTKFTGRGLGLAAVAGIVRSHRGAIDVESEVGKGSTFRVYLPAPEIS
jgi:PAS domain S-box-containing protein